MNEATVMQAAQKEERVSVTLSPELYSEVSRRAEENDLSLNRAILQLLRAGIQAENQKKQRLAEMLHQYRETTDPQEAERLGDELGTLIFGR